MSKQRNNVSKASNLPSPSKERKYYKNAKNREERRRAIGALAKGEQPSDGYGRYAGWLD